jgi:hypothetical protein
MCDADAEGADWREVARAKWMTEVGYRHLLRGGVVGQV